MRIAVFCVITRRVVVISCRRFETACRNGPPETSARNYHYSLHNNPETRNFNNILYIHFFRSLEYRLNEWMKGVNWINMVLTHGVNQNSFQVCNMMILIAVQYYVLYHSNSVIFVSDRNVIFVVPWISACLLSRGATLHA